MKEQKSVKERTGEAGKDWVSAAEQQANKTTCIRPRPALLATWHNLVWQPGGGAPRTGCEGRQVIGRGPGDEEVGEGVFLQWVPGRRSGPRKAVKGSDGRRYRR